MALLLSDLLQQHVNAANTQYKRQGGQELLFRADAFVANAFLLHQKTAGEVEFIRFVLAAHLIFYEGTGNLVDPKEKPKSRPRLPGEFYRDERSPIANLFVLRNLYFHLEAVTPALREEHIESARQVFQTYCGTPAPLNPDYERARQRFLLQFTALTGQLAEAPDLSAATAQRMLVELPEATARLERQLAAKPALACDPYRRAEGALPGLLEAALPEIEPITRAGVIADLGEKIRAAEKSLILVQAPIGAGKTALIAAACRGYPGTIIAVNLDGAPDYRKLVEGMLECCELSDDERQAIDASIESACDVVRAHLPAKSVVVFTNPPDGQLGDGLWKFLFELALRRHVIVIVEVWDAAAAAARISRNTRWVHPVAATKFTRLADPEIDAWIAARLLAPQLRAADFSEADGHPYLISMVLTQLAGLPAPLISKTAVEDRILTWLECPDVKKYFEVIEGLQAAAQFDPWIVQWAALFWPAPIPDELCAARSKALPPLFLAGLLVYSGGAAHARGWFHTYCLQRLAADPEGRLLITASELNAVPRPVLERVFRGLHENRGKHPGLSGLFDQALKVIDASLGGTRGDEYAPSERYVAPLADASGYAAVLNDSDLAHTFWALEQAARTENWAAMATVWDRALRDPQTAHAHLEAAWWSLRALKRAVWSLGRAPNAHHFVAGLKSVGEIVAALRPATSNHRYHKAGLLLYVIKYFAARGDKDTADVFFTTAEAELAALRNHDAAADHERSLTELDYHVERTRYMLARSALEAREVLARLGAIVSREHEKNHADRTWNRRLADWLSERVELDSRLEAGTEGGDDEAAKTALERLFAADATLGIELILRNISTHRITDLDAGRLLRLATPSLEHVSRRRSGDELPRCETLAAELLLGRPEAARRLVENVLESSAMAPGEFALAARCYFKLAPRFVSEWRRLADPKDFYRLAPPGAAGALDFWKDLIFYAAFRAKRLPPSNPDGDPFDDASHRLLDAVVTHALGECAGHEAAILAQQYSLRSERYQAHLRWVRANWSEREKHFRSADPAADTIAALRQLCPNHPVSLRTQAMYERHRWNFDAADALSRRALELASSARARRQLVIFRFRLFCAWVFSPEILRSPLTPVAGPGMQDELRALAAELALMFPRDAVKYRAFEHALAQPDDVAFWTGLCEEIEKRIGAEFWDSVSRQAIDGASPVEDLTDNLALRSLCHPLLAASQNDRLPQELRTRLAGAAAHAALAAFEWERGNGINRNLATRYMLAVSICLAIRERAVDGEAPSPLLSKGRGRVMSWRALARSNFDWIHNVAIGRFREHVDLLTGIGRHDDAPAILSPLLSGTSAPVA